MSLGTVVFVVAVAVVVAGGATLVWWRLGRVRADAEREARALAGGAATERIENTAAFVGRVSAGRTARGSGTLLLSGSDLVWVMGNPRRTLVIPRERIDGARPVHELLGHAPGRSFLAVEHRDEAGEADVTAWEVADVDAWVAAVGAVERT